MDKPKPDYNAWLNKYEPIKVKGFKALYYRYLYLFGKIRKKETPQRVSFFMREELIKFERYQKQFHFLYENDIETTTQLSEMKQSAEDGISELTSKRSALYRKPDAKNEISEINAELKKLRATLRMCNSILSDSECLNYHYNEVMRLEEELQRGHKQRTNGKILG